MVGELVEVRGDPDGHEGQKVLQEGHPAPPAEGLGQSEAGGVALLGQVQ